jgi:hypothetical protein
MFPRSKCYFVFTHLLLSALCALTLASKANAEDGDDEGVVGTWIITAELAPGFIETEFTVINPGGTMTLTSSVFNPHSSQNPFLPPFLVVDISDGYGRLRREGESNRFAGTFKRLLFAGERTDPNLYGEFFVGQHVGVAAIQFVLTLRHGPDGDTMDGPFTFQTRNLRDEVVGTGSGTASLVRLNVEPLMR